MPTSSPGARLRAALDAEKPLQVVGAVNAYTARLAERCGYRALYLSGGGVAASSLGKNKPPIPVVGARGHGRVDTLAPEAPVCG